MSNSTNFSGTAHMLKCISRSEHSVIEAEHNLLTCSFTDNIYETLIAAVNGIKYCYKQIVSCCYTQLEFQKMASPPPSTLGFFILKKTSTVVNTGAGTPTVSMPKTLVYIGHQQLLVFVPLFYVPQLGTD